MGTIILGDPAARLRAALEEGSERKAFLALEDGAPLAPVGDWSPLKAAFDLGGVARGLSRRIGMMLISAGADPDARFEWPMPGYTATPAFYAASRLLRASIRPSPVRDADYLDFLTMLLGAGAKAPSAGLHAVLEPAFPSEEAAEAVDALLLAGLKPEIGDFLRAMEHGTTDALDALAWACPSSEVSDHRGFTPLHHAAAGGLLEACRTLLEAGAAVDSQARDGSTPLLLAASKEGNERICNLLLLSGADPNLRSDSGLAPIEAALTSGLLGNRHMAESFAKAIARRKGERPG